MKGWACCVLICHRQKRTVGDWGMSSNDFAYFRVSCDILLRSPWKRSSPCVPMTVAEPKHSHFKGGIDVSSAIPPSKRLSCWRTAEVVSPDSAKRTEFDAT